MAIDEQFYIYTLTEAGHSRRLVSPLPTDFANHNGLCSQALAGEFSGADAAEDSPETFTGNPEYVRFLQWALAKHAPSAPGFIQKAEANPDNPVFIVDIRALLQGKEPQEEDLIGTIILENGTPKQFQAAPNYKVLTEHGFLRIDPWLREKYLEELQQHALEQKQTATTTKQNEPQVN